jgi:major membrane immunogen (membrane-anchored lipoprotein)
VILFTVDDNYGFSTHDVYDGSIVRCVDQWAHKGGKAKAKEIVKAAEARGEALEKRKDGLVDEMVEYNNYLNRVNNNDDNVIMARKHVTADTLTENYRAHVEGRLTLKDTYTQSLPDEVRKLGA